MKRVAGALLVTLIATAAGCSDSDSPEPTAVVVSTDIVGSLVKAVAGPSADVTVLDDRDGAEQTTDADVVFVVGGGYEAGMDDALTTARREGAVVVELLDGLGPVPYGSSPAYADREGEGSGPSRPATGRRPSAIPTRPSGSMPTGPCRPDGTSPGCSTSGPPSWPR